MSELEENWMSERENNVKEKSVLLMLSGGRDSFLSACRLISKGYFIYMVTYDNGHMSHAENAEEVARRIINRFGDDKAKFVGIHPIAQNIGQIMQKALYLETAELCQCYPHLLAYQVNCLACHTVMYLHSIAYCKAHDMKIIAEGAREQQSFFVELPEMRQRYEELCKEYGIELLTPVYELQSDIERKKELGEWGFLPKSYEPQCWLGCPMKQELTLEQRESLTLYYDNEIKPKAKQIVESLIEKKKICINRSGLHCSYE